MTYLTPNERARICNCGTTGVAHEYSCEYFYTPDVTAMLDSHAVLDKLAADLATALANSLEMLHCDDAFCNGNCDVGEQRRNTLDVLAAYYAATQGANDEA